MPPEQLDMVLGWVIWAALGGLAIALMMFVAAKVGQRSARAAGIVAAISSLFYVSVGAAGAAIRVEMDIEPAKDETIEPPKTDGPAPEAEPAEAQPDPAIAEAAKRLSDAVAAEDWDAADEAHAALKALDAEHADLAPAMEAITVGRAAAEAEVDSEGTGGETEGTGTEGAETEGDATGGSTGAGESGESGEPAADDAATDEAEEVVEEDAEVEETPPAPKPKKKKRKKRKKKRPQPASDDGGDGGEPAGDDDGGAPPEPEPEPDPDPEPEPEPAGDEG